MADKNKCYTISKDGIKEQTQDEFMDHLWDGWQKKVRRQNNE